MSKLSKIEKMSDKKVLEEMYNLLSRADIHAEFIRDSGDLVTHSVVVVTCGDKFFASTPQQLPTPLIPVEKEVTHH